MHSKLTRLVVTLGVGLLLAACGSDHRSGRVSISGRIATGGAPGNALSVAGGRVSIDHVWMVIRDIELGLPRVEGEISAANGPFLLDLGGAALDGGITQQFSIEVPAGTYDDLRFEVHKLEDGQRIGVPVVDDGRLSVVVRMTVDGTDAVTLRSQLSEKQRIARTFVVADGATPDNITIVVDPAGWFTASNGSFLDPRADANLQAIEDNIRTSIDAFDDDDHDGHDDHGADDGPNHT